MKLERGKHVRLKHASYELSGGNSKIVSKRRLSSLLASNSNMACSAFALYTNENVAYFQCHSRTYQDMMACSWDNARMGSWIEAHIVASEELMVGSMYIVARRVQVTRAFGCYKSDAWQDGRLSFLTFRFLE